MKRLSRRHFLFAVSGSLFAFTGWYIYKNDYEELIVSTLKDKLDTLDLDESGLRAFARDFVEQDGSFGYKGALLARAEPLVDSLDLEDVAGEDLEEFEYRVVSKFLLSSDFFLNDADESKPVRYLTYNNFYQVGCLNPFAQLD